MLSTETITPSISVSNGRQRSFSIIVYNPVACSDSPYASTSASSTSSSSHALLKRRPRLPGATFPTRFPFMPASLDDRRCGLRSAPAVYGSPSKHIVLWRVHANDVLAECTLGRTPKRAQDASDGTRQAILVDRSEPDGSVRDGAPGQCAAPGAPGSMAAQN